VQFKTRDIWDNLIVVPLTITVRRDRGAGEVLGVTSVQTVGGTATFSDLSYFVAEEIDLRFEGGAFRFTTREITVEPGPPG